MDKNTREIIKFVRKLQRTARFKRGNHLVLRDKDKQRKGR